MNAELVIWLIAHLVWLGYYRFEGHHDVCVHWMLGMGSYQNAAKDLSIWEYCREHFHSDDMWEKAIILFFIFLVLVIFHYSGIVYGIDLISWPYAILFLGWCGAARIFLHEFWYSRFSGNEFLHISTSDKLSRLFLKLGFGQSKSRIFLLYCGPIILTESLFIAYFILGGL
jgi:hypothetical protein